MFCGGLPLLSQFFFPPDLGFRVNGCSFGVYINWDYAAHLHKGWFPQKTWQAGAVSDTRGCRGAQGGEARNAARRDPGMISQILTRYLRVNGDEPTSNS